MAPSKIRGRPIATRHLVCGTCSSWVEFVSFGCTNSWADMRGGTCVFECKGCRRVARLVQADYGNHEEDGPRTRIARKKED